MKTKGIVYFGVLVALVLAAAAQDKNPDFSGKWKLDTAKSDFGMMPGPTSQTSVIDHKEPKIKITTTAAREQGEQTSEANYTLDGKESTNTMGPREIKTIAKWEGKKIVMKSKFDYQGSEIELADTYSLSEDGKGLTIDRAIKSPMGEIAQKMVFVKSE
jgi:hypothetical protein